MAAVVDRDAAPDAELLDEVETIPEEESVDEAEESDDRDAVGVAAALPDATLLDVAPAEPVADAADDAELEPVFVADALSRHKHAQAETEDDSEADDPSVLLSDAALDTLGDVLNE